MARKTVRTPVVEFARGPERLDASGDVVRRRGVIFRAGDYSATHAFAMTPDELKSVASTFRGPIPIDHGHPTTDGPIDFGRLESVEASPDGTTLYGTTATPAWLDNALGEARWLVSASFDRATKAIRRLSLVTRPAIPDAELRAAFACACGQHAATTTEPEERPMGDEWKAKALADLEAMSESERAGVLAVLAGQAHEDEDDEEDEPADEPEAGTSDFSEAAQLRAEVEELKAERRREKSALFAAELKRAGRIAPYEEQATAAVMFSAMSDDAALGDAVNFAVGDKSARGTREAMIRAVYTQRPAHGLAEERLASFGRTLPNGGQEDEADQKRRHDEMLSYTATGRAVLARRNGHAS